MMTMSGHCESGSAVASRRCPHCDSVRDTTHVRELLASIRRLAVDQPLLEHRLGELSSALTQVLG
jgi:hypothetical protein